MEKRLRLKVDSHNTITIHPIKDSWSREEMLEFAKFAKSYQSSTSVEKAFQQWVSKH